MHSLYGLQQQGFDFTYDKRLYDRLFYDSPLSVRDHLRAEPDYRDKCLRFIENHDEERAPVNFGKKKSQAAGITTATVPGLRFFHDGQLEGRRIRTPIHLRREPKESIDPDTATVYKRLLKFINTPVTHDGEWIFLPSGAAWEKSQTYLGIMAWLWQLGQDRKMVVINYSMLRAQAAIYLPEDLLQKDFIQFQDVLAEKIYDRTREELLTKGLYIDLHPWQAHLFDLIV